MMMLLNFFKGVNAHKKKEKVLTFPVNYLIGEEKAETATLTLNINDGVINDNFIIYRAYIAQRKNERQGTVNTLTRAEVRGGGRKPWKQKGTGRARAGSNRSPLWKGGGVSFGPKPKSYSSKLNRKEWKLAMRSLLVTRESIITVINNIKLDTLNNNNQSNYQTASFIKLFKNFNIKFSEKTTVIIPSVTQDLVKATRNIKTITLMRADTLNLAEILKSRHLIISKDSLKIIEETYNG